MGVGGQGGGVWVLVGRVEVCGCRWARWRCVGGGVWVLVGRVEVCVGGQCGGVWV